MWSRRRIPIEHLFKIPPLPLPNPRPDGWPHKRIPASELETGFEGVKQGFLKAQELWDKYHENRDREFFEKMEALKPPPQKQLSPPVVIEESRDGRAAVAGKEESDELPF